MLICTITLPAFTGDWVPSGLCIDQFGTPIFVCFTDLVRVLCRLQGASRLWLGLKKICNFSFAVVVVLCSGFEQLDCEGGVV